MANDASTRGFEGTPPPLAWVTGLIRVLVLLALNAVPIWGFTQDEWSPGTTLALYWFQTFVGIPITAALIVLHRRATQKYGHYSGTTTTTIVGGGKVTKRATFLNVFLWMAIPFTVAHGIFLAALLGLMLNKGPSAVNLDDLRMGMVATLNIMALGFAVDALQVARRPFAWISYRAQTLLSRTMVVQLAILLGVAVLAFADKASAFFGVFLFLKLLADLKGELPEWDPKEMPPWLARIMNRIGGPDSDFSADMKKLKEEEQAQDEANERRVDPAKLNWRL